MVHIHVRVVMQTPEYIASYRPSDEIGGADDHNSDDGWNVPAAAGDIAEDEDSMDRIYSRT